MPEALLNASTVRDKKSRHTLPATGPTRTTTTTCAVPGLLQGTLTSRRSRIAARNQ